MAKPRQWLQRFNHLDHILRSNLINNRHTFSRKPPSLLESQNGLRTLPSETSGGKSSHPTNYVDAQLALNFHFL